VEQENHSPVPETAPAEEPAARASLLPENASSASPSPGANANPDPAPEEYRGVDWAFIGDNGLRAGWSVLIFVPIYFIALFALGTAASLIVGNIVHNRLGSGTALSAGVGELVPFFAMLIAAAIVGLIEHRSILDFNLKGPHRVLNFFSGFAAGFAALSVLVGALAAGGWLHFGPIAMTGTNILKFAALWGITFLLVGCFEEGVFRCYLQFTLTRGINFWWALAAVAGFCLDLVLRAKGNGVWGVYAIALLGLLPCFALHWLRAESAGFWQAAWVTSTLFGFIHTGNNGENWIGIFAAAAIGFVFCVSVRVTGSAWWAIGCHFAWDWAETYFYGAADSGLPAQGHFLTTNPVGNALWSGGTDGPEGSLLVLAVILLLLGSLLVIYGRKRPAAAAAMEHQTA
jgi:membrane protease YdiL (CAAX protease family)